MNTNVLRSSRSDGVATLTLNRPEAGNALDIPLARALLDAAIACDEDPAIRCVILKGEGRYFCVGGDVASFSTAGDRLAILTKKITAYLHMAISRLVRMEKPLITAINGPAAGAGMSLAALGDLAFAAPSAHFTVAYSAIGLTPDAGMTYILPRLVGLRKAQELIFTNKRLSAESAVLIGLINRVVDAASLDQEAARFASVLAAGATSALGQTRRLLLQSFGESLEGQLETEARAIADAARSANGREGVAAFVAKRQPNFV